MNEETIDPAALRRLLDAIGGDPEDLTELIEDYCEAAPELAGSISASADAGDVEKARIAAHTLKSNARDFGAHRLSSLCAAVEQSCRDGAPPDRETAAAIVAEEAEARRVLASLHADDIGS